MLLSAELRARLERLSLVSRKRVRASFGGRHASTHKGESLDFADYRPYVVGDDYRRIDHNLHARLGQLVVRQFEAEEELAVRVIVDTSASMGMYAKHEMAVTIAGMVSYLALAGGDRVSLYALPGKDRPLAIGPAGRHLSQWPLLERWLESLSAGGTVPMDGVLRTLVGSSTNRGATVLVSDLLDPAWERTLDGAGLGAGGLILHLLASSEITPELVGDLMLVDVEHGTRTPVSTSEDTVRAYRVALEEFVTGVAGRARRAGLDYLLVPTTPDAPERVLAALASTGAIR